MLIANRDAKGKSTHLAINQRLFDDPVEDFPKAGTTEIWEYVNLSGDGHAMHVHLVQFHLLDRQRLDTTGYRAAYDAWIAGGRRPEARPDLARHLRGEPIAPGDYETGRLDTTVAQPGMVTRIVLRFDLPEGAALPATYIQHCHMLEHEDNEMMRPWRIIA
uniref:multicopper oxidase domain-containing protein n=1 Tax=Herbidospora sakaeratensis TaxID=564415 RepID=UPI000781E23F|nr:multicopper oxidase domain-containing protein [Herbidospora sakaeratensis]